jgi:hypothetical protein
MVGDINDLATDFESCSFKISNYNQNVVAHKLGCFAELLVCKFLLLMM